MATDKKSSSGGRGKTSSSGDKMALWGKQRVRLSKLTRLDRETYVEGRAMGRIELSKEWDQVPTPPPPPLTFLHTALALFIPRAVRTSLTTWLYGSLDVPSLCKPPAHWEPC